MNLITGTLLDSFDWFRTCPANWKESAREEFVSLLRRVEKPASAACQRGIDFENLICKNCNSMTQDAFREHVTKYYSERGADLYYLDNAVSVSCATANRCRGGRQQEELAGVINVDGQDYKLLGFADVMFSGRIVDIKTTGKYKGGYHYVKRSQHYVYSYCSGVTNFEYLVADYHDGKFPWALHKIEFELDMEENTWVLQKRIKEMVDYLRDTDLWLYYEVIFSGNN